MIFTKAIKQYGVKQHRGFFTVQRKMVHYFFGIPYKVEWKPVTELRYSRLLGTQEQPKHFASHKTAYDFIHREIESYRQPAKL